MRKRGDLSILTGRIAAAFITLAVFLLPGCSRDHNAADPVTRALRPFVTPPGEPRPRVMLIGWDGATFNMIDPLLAAGRLPNLQRLIDAGVQYELESTVIPISSAAWVSAMTGMGPGKTGVFGFFNRAPGSYGLTLVDSRTRRVPAVWNILNHYGLRTHVVSIPITFPPERVLGVNFGCMLAPFDSDYAWPQGLTGALRRLGFEPDLDAWQETTPITAARIEQDHRVRTEILCSLAEHSDWDLLAANYKSLDVLSHRLYNGQIGGPASDIAEHYERLDDALGSLMAAAGPQTDVLVMSDHGFGLYTHQLSVHGVLAEAGLLAVRGERKRQQADQGRPLAEMFAALAAEDLRNLDMSQTVVYCDSTEGNYVALRLNLAGREPQGIVPPEQRDATAADVIERLLAMRLPGGDKPVFVRAWRMEELYPGPATPDLPEILLEADRMFLCRPYFGRPYAIRLPIPLPEHERDGVLLAAGPSIRHAAQRGRASVLDIAPTLLALLDTPVWREMDGRVIESLFARPPEIEYVVGAELGVEVAWAETADAAGAAQQDEVLKRLGQLGYIHTTADDDEDEDEPATQPSGQRP